MKRKLLAMILSALTILPVILTGCAKDETSLADTSSRKSLTLTLHCITGDETTEEARLAVQDAINEITMTRYKTQIILRYYKASEYEDKMDELIENISKEQDEALNAEESQAAAEKSLSGFRPLMRSSRALPRSGLFGLLLQTTMMRKLRKRPMKWSPVFSEIRR